MRKYIYEQIVNYHREIIQMELIEEQNAENKLKLEKLDKNNKKKKKKKSDKNTLQKQESEKSPIQDQQTVISKENPQLSPFLN